MDQHLEEIREQQKDSWNNRSGYWKKWEDITMEFLRPSGNAIIEAMQPAGNDLVLDVASGAGEPALTIASRLDGGKVIITDVAEAMWNIAKQEAERRRIANIEAKLCDACDLPFPDNYFDAISCRMGFMFFPDMQLAANEMARVLRPGGRLATSVWNIPEKNSWVTVTMRTIMNEMNLPDPPSGAPGMFRACKPGLMKTLFEKAGLVNIKEKEVSSKFHAGTFEDYWSFMTEVSATVATAFARADEEMKTMIKQKVADQVAKKFPGENLVLDTSAIVISAEK